MSRRTWIERLALVVAWAILLVLILIAVTSTGCSRPATDTPPPAAAAAAAAAAASRRQPPPRQSAQPSSIGVAVATTQPGVVAASASVDITGGGSGPGVVVVLPDGSRIEAPAGSSVDIEDVGGGLTRADRATSQGGSAHGVGQEISGNAAVLPGSVGLDPLGENAASGGGAAGTTGGINSAFKGVGLPPSARKYGGYGLGFALIIGGVVLLALPLFYPPAAIIPLRKPIAWGAIIAGITLIALVYIAASPILMGCLVGTVALGGLAFAAWSLLGVAGRADAASATATTAVTLINRFRGGTGSAAYQDPATAAWRDHIPAIYDYLKSGVADVTDSRDLPKVTRVVDAIKKGL